MTPTEQAWQQFRAQIGDVTIPDPLPPLSRSYQDQTDQQRRTMERTRKWRKKQHANQSHAH